MTNKFFSSNCGSVQNFWISLLMIGFVASQVGTLAAEELPSPVMESGRFYGRGNTYVAAYDSEDATRGNPATLTEPQKLHLQFRTLPIDALLGKNSIDTFSELLKLFQNGLSSDGFGDLMDLMSSKFGKRQYARLQGAPLGLRTKYFELSPFASLEFYADPRIPSLPEIKTKFDSAVGTNISIAIPLGQKLQLGLSVRPMMRYYYSQEFPLISVVDVAGSKQSDSSQSELFSIQKGTAVGVDLGAIYNVIPEFRLGLTVKDVGYTSYLNDPENPPPAYPQIISVGSLYRKKMGRWNLDTLADVHDITNPQGLNFFRLFHLGLEFGTSYATWDNDVGLLFGVNEGYLTFGAYVEMWVLRLDLVSYGVELGISPGQRQDRRYGLTARILTMSF